MLNIIFLSSLPFLGPQLTYLEARFHSRFLLDEGPGCCAYLLSLWYNKSMMDFEYLDHLQGIATAHYSTWREVDAHGRAALLSLWYNNFIVNFEYQSTSLVRHCTAQYCSWREVHRWSL